MNLDHRHFFYLIKGIKVELINPPRELGNARADLDPTARVWCDYAEAVSRGSAESITVEWDEAGVIKPHVVRRTT